MDQKFNLDEPMSRNRRGTVRAGQAVGIFFAGTSCPQSIKVLRIP